VRAVTVLPETGASHPVEGWERMLFEAYKVKNVLDVGANIGGFIPMWLEQGATTIHAVEPVPECYDQLVATYADDPRVHCHPLGVSSVPGKLTDVNIFNCWTLQPEASTSLARALEFVGKPPFNVELTTIDDLLLRTHFKPDFIKIDVDGYEPKALRGARDYIVSRRPLIMLELSYLPSVIGDCCECMIRELYGLGYILTRLNGGKRLPTVRDVMRIFPWDTSFDVICEPQ
jgi:FkbM family methyltransferase